MDDRKKRLAALAARAGRAKPIATSEVNDNTTDTQQPEATAAIDNSEEKTNVKFRNYTPSDPSLQTNEEEENKSKRPRDENDSDKPNTAGEPPQKKSALEEALAKAKQDLKESSATSSNNNVNNELTAMAPKKINWDLKRDIQPKLDKLEKRTQKAIVSLLKERLAKEAEEAANDDEEEPADELD